MNRFNILNNLSMKLPDGNGLDLLIEIRETGKNMAIIMLTGSGNEETAVAAFKAGANDYLVKQDEYILKLPNVIESTLRNHQRNLQKTATKIHAWLLWKLIAKSQTIVKNAEHEVHLPF